MTTASPTKLLAARYAIAATAIASTTALTVGLAAPAVAATNVAHTYGVAAQQQPLTTDQEVALMASIGLYPVGPGAQIMRNLGMGTPQDVLNNLAGLAQIIPGDAGAQLKSTIEAVSKALAAAQTGINLPILGNVGLPEVSVPPAGPAGTIDQVADLDSAATTQILLSGIKTVLMNGDSLGVALGALGTFTGIDTTALKTLVEDLPLNVPGTAGEAEVLGISGGAFVSSADKFAIIPTWGLGGTNFALASPTFLNDPKFAKTAILAIALRNTSRPGGGLAALLNPLSSTVGLNLSNVDGTGNPREIIGGGIPPFVSADITEYDGNVTVWDITAAYDILSDAPSTVFNPLAWANSGVGAVAPTYLIPANITEFAAVLEDVTSGQIDIGTLNTLLGTINSTIEMFNVKVGDDGNLYVTYNSGHLPLLEPFQFVPRTVSYIPGFNISTPVSNSFEDVLTQLVAQGYQDVNMTVDGEGVATFVRGFDMAGTQAKFWQNPISWTNGMETPQTVFNSIITGLQQNMLNPDANEFEVFGNSEIGNLVYRNAASVAIAKFVSDALEQLRDELNPMMNDAQDAFRPVAKALDDATVEVNKVIDSGLDEVSKLGVDLSGPMIDANHEVNKVSDQINNGIREVVGLKPITSPPQYDPAVTSGPSTQHDNPDVTDIETASVANRSISLTNSKPESVTDRIQKAPERALNEVTSIPGKAERELRKGGDKLQERGEKLRGSLDKRETEIREIAETASKDPIKGITETGKFAGERVKRAAKDVGNGVKKVGEAGQRIAKSVEKTVKRVTGSSDKPKADNNK